MELVEPESAGLWARGVAAQALWRILNEEHLVLTDYILDEFRDVIARKFPMHAETVETFLGRLEYDLLPVATSGVTIRDANDQVILDSAIAAAVDIIVTGDKDFHALAMTMPLVLTPREFVELA